MALKSLQKIYTHSHFENLAFMGTRASESWFDCVFNCNMGTWVSVAVLLDVILVQDFNNFVVSLHVIIMMQIPTLKNLAFMGTRASES